MENDSGLQTQEEWEYYNVKRGEDEMTDFERDKWQAEEMKFWFSQFEKGKLDSEYSDYIMEHCAGDRMICNGDMLVGAVEDGYLLDEFLNSVVNSQRGAK